MGADINVSILVSHVRLLENVNVSKICASRSLSVEDKLTAIKKVRISAEKGIRGINDKHSINVDIK